MGLKKRLAYLLGAIAVVALAFPAFGFTVTGKGEIGRDGKATAELTFVSELSESDFRAKLDDYVEAYNNDSAEKAEDTDSVTITSVKKTDNGYVVKAKTRRIDKITVSCAMDVSPASDYSIEDGQDRRKIEKWMNGDMSNTIKSAKGMSGNEVVTIGRPNDRDTRLTYSADSYEIQARRANGEVVARETFFDELAGAKKSARMATMCFANVEGLTDITITYPADVKYYGGLNATLVDSKTVKYETSDIKANVTTTSSEIKEVELAVGWAVYDLGASRLVIAIAAVAGVAVAGGLVWFCIYVNGLGKKAIAKENEQ